ncbi:DinB family protein [Pseudalkalibacillus salsuginis]|uniref:DinB family protein n=1 Tax=Pseudalkalibacillus salsuginis TaxID=2910972 RepID=UPI001F35DCB7|nr:DinB family protein [Pseudalkalibacillus salsuginis]MCF6411575.1 DinB family protein [Pseudalkalibacillus salsuginis]
MNHKEYEWVKENREVLLDFCSKIDPNDFTREMVFGWQNVRDTLVHVANCYHAWLGSFVLLQTKKPITPRENLPAIGMEEIRVLFGNADTYVNEVLESYALKWDEPIVQPIPWRESSEAISMTPRKLLMHTVTHEYHHKGQIMAMARQMGYESLNTDVLGARD